MHQEREWLRCNSIVLQRLRCPYKDVGSHCQLCATCHDGRMETFLQRKQPRNKLLSNGAREELPQVYSMTVGKLSWKTDDLAQVYSAKCQVETNCNGLYFNLSNDNQHIVVGEAHIPNSSRDSYYQGLTKWQVLAASKSEMIAPSWTTIAGTNTVPILSIHHTIRIIRLTSLEFNW